MADEDDRVAMVSDVRSVETSLRTELTAAITAEGEKIRRHFDIVAEQLRADFRVVVEKTEVTSKKVDRLVATNAAEHAAFVEAIADHEVRLRVLERIREPQTPSKS